MSVQEKKGKRGLRKHGRCLRKPCKKRYKAENRRFKNKLKRVRQSSGERAAEEYIRRFRVER